MALSFFTSEAPRDFRVSSTESEEHYAKCVLCYQPKKNYYCPDCIRCGNFVHSSIPYSDRFADKQLKLLRLKTNRKHVLDRCEKLVVYKNKKDSLLTEAKPAKDKLDWLKLAIEQRKRNIEEKKKLLTNLSHHNNELRAILPRYQKKVAQLGKHAQDQRIELQVKITAYNDKAQSLEALRRSRIRQLTKYVFPVYMSYDTSDSIEDLEFLGEEPEEEHPKRLHIVSPWIDTDGEFAHIQNCANENKQMALITEPAENPAHRISAGLGLAAQLVSLLAWTLDTRLPHAIKLAEYYNWRVWDGGVAGKAKRLCACACALAVRASLKPPPAPPARALAALHALAVSAASDEPMLGRVEGWMSTSLTGASEAWTDACGAPGAEADDCEPPEHLVWPEAVQLEELSCTPPPQPPPSLVNSAVASIAAVFRGWTK